MELNHKYQSDPEVLTSIHPAYTLHATPEYASEVEELMVKNFLNTLAEVALAVASRQIQENPK